MRGRFVDMLAANPADPAMGSDFNIATTPNGRYANLNAVVANSRALVTWLSGEADEYIEARGRIIDMQATPGDDPGIGDDFLISDRLTGMEGFGGFSAIDCLAQGSRMMAVTSLRKTSCVFIDMTADPPGDPRMGDVFDIDDAVAVGVAIAQYGDNVFMASVTVDDEEEPSLQGCFLDGVTGQKISDDFNLGTAINLYLKDVIVIGSRAVVVPLVASDFRITVADLESDTLESFSVPIGQAYISCSFANSGERLLGSWCQPDTDTVNARYLDYLPDNPYLLKYGVSNFLAAPLIERDYSVSVKINEYF